MFRADPKRQKLSQLEDQLNQRFGRGTARIGGLPNKPCSWINQQTQQSHHTQTALSRKQYSSPRYTTCWVDLPIVGC